MFTVMFDFGNWIDAAYGQVIESAIQRFCQVCSRVGGSEMHWQSAMRQLDSDCCRQRGFTYAAFAH